MAKQLTDWFEYRRNIPIVAKHNRKKFTVNVIGTGLAGSALASSLAKLGFNVNFIGLSDIYRAHSVGAQGGVNSPRNAAGDGDNVYNFFKATLKGGDYRAREDDVYRMSQLAVPMIDHLVEIGVPFARDLMGNLKTRGFGGSLVNRTFYASAQTGKYLLYALNYQVLQGVHDGLVKLYSNHEVVDLITHNDICCGAVVSDQRTGETFTLKADATAICTGGYSNVYRWSTNAFDSNGTVLMQAYRKGAAFAGPSFTQIHPTCIPRSSSVLLDKLRLMSESLRNHGRVWVPKEPGALEKYGNDPNKIPENERFYVLEERYPAYGNLVPRDVASRNIKDVCDSGLGLEPGGRAVYLDFKDTPNDVLHTNYENLFEMYEEVTGVNAYEQPMKIYPAPHYTMGGLHVDYDLMTSVQGLFALGEVNYSVHGANRLGASSLIQCVVDGLYPGTDCVMGYLDGVMRGKGADAPDSVFSDALKLQNEAAGQLLKMNGSVNPYELHDELGQLLWDQIGINRDEAGLKSGHEALQGIRDKFKDVNILNSSATGMNQQLSYLRTLRDYIDIGELMFLDSIDRKESCGALSRADYPERDDENWMKVSKFNQGSDGKPVVEYEDIEYSAIQPDQRSYV